MFDDTDYDLFPNDVLFKESGNTEDINGISELNDADVAFIIKELDSMESGK